MIKKNPWRRKTKATVYADRKALGKMKPPSKVKGVHGDVPVKLWRLPRHFSNEPQEL